MVLYEISVFQHDLRVLSENVESYCMFQYVCIIFWLSQSGVIARVAFVLVLSFDVLRSARRAWRCKRGPHTLVVAIADVS